MTFARRLRRSLPCVALTLAGAGALLASPGGVSSRAPSDAGQIASNATLDFEALPYAPARYVCYRADVAPVVDGQLGDPVWQRTPWTTDFVDIEGGDRARPRLRTRAKMLWDDTYFYVSAEMEEPDVWGTLTDRDAIIYNDNDIELFIDPDGDTVNYYELEANPLGTVFNLLLPHTYRDGGPAIIGWDISGLKLAVGVRGTVNTPGDTDEAWTVEMAVPWRILLRGRSRAAAAAPRRTVAREFLPRRMAVRRAGRPLRAEGGPCHREDRAVLRLHVVATGVQGHPHARAVGIRPVRLHRGRRRDAGVHGGRERPGEMGPAAPLLQATPVSRGARGLRERPGRAGAGSITVEGLEFRPSLQAANAVYLITAPGFNGAVVSIRQDGQVSVGGGGGAIMSRAPQADVTSVTPSASTIERGRHGFRSAQGSAARPAVGP